MLNEFIFVWYSCIHISNLSTKSTTILVFIYTSTSVSFHVWNFNTSQRDCIDGEFFSCYLYFSCYCHLPNHHKFAFIYSSIHRLNWIREAIYKNWAQKRKKVRKKYSAIPFYCSWVFHLHMFKLITDNVVNGFTLTSDFSLYKPFGKLTFEFISMLVLIKY